MINHLLGIALLGAAAIIPAFAQQTPTDSSSLRLSEATFQICERTAEPLLRVVLAHRAHLGIWPIDEDDLRSFLATTTTRTPPANWSPCRLSGEPDGCVISIRISPGIPASFLLSDTVRIRRTNARIYVTAEQTPGTKLRATVTGELLSAELLTVDGRLIALPPYASPVPRYRELSTSVADSVLFIR